MKQAGGTLDDTIPDRPTEMDFFHAQPVARRRLLVALLALMMACVGHAQMVTGERRALALPNGASAEFARAVAYESSFAVVGDPGADAVHVYMRSSPGGLFALDGSLSRPGIRYGRFGLSVALHDGRLYVGAPGVHQNSVGDEVVNGAVSVYRREASGWLLERVLQPGGGTVPVQDGFGSHVAVAGRHLLVAASDERAIYAFDARNGSTPFQRIDVAARVPSGGLWDERNGLLSLVVDGDSAVIGLRFDDLAAFHALRWDGVRWVWEAEIFSQEWPSVTLGAGAALRSGHLLVPTANGSRHFERLTDSRWIERSPVGASSTATLLPHTRAAFGDLGVYVTESSAVRLYTPSAGSWQRGSIVEARPSVGTSRAIFAAALSASGNGLMVGSPGFNEAAILVGPPSAQATTSIDVLPPSGEPIIEGTPARLVVYLRSAESVLGASVDLFDGDTWLCTATMASSFSGILGHCDTTFRNVGRRAVEARFAGTAALAPATRRLDIVVQPALRVVGFGRAAEMTVGVPVSGRLGIYAPGATPPFRFTPMQLLPGVSVDADGAISGTPTQAITAARPVVVVKDGSMTRYGVEFAWSIPLDIDVAASRVPRTSIGIGTPASLEAGSREVLPYSVLGPPGVEASFGSQSPEVCRVDVSAGLRVEALRMGVCVLSATAAGTGYGAVTTIWRVPVSTRGRPLMFAIPDRIVIDHPPTVGSVTAAATVRVLANDLFDPSKVDLSNGLTIVRQPSTGIVQPRSDGSITYTPSSMYTAVRDSFRYRLCETNRVTCSEATAWIVALPGVPVGATLEVEGQSGSSIMAFRPIPSGGPTVRRTGSLLPPSSLSMAIPASFGIDSPFDDGFSGASFFLRDVPANPGAAADAWRVHAELSSTAERPDVALILGVDRNRNGQPDVDETECATVAVAALASCDTRIPRQGGQGAQRYWVMVQNRTESALGARVDVYAEAATPVDASPVTVTGPTSAGSMGEPWPTRITWDDPTLLVGDRRLAYVSFWRDGTFLGEAPLRIVRRGGRSSSLALRDGVAQQLSLMPSERQSRLFFDVPASAASVRFDMAGAEGVALNLSRAIVQSEHDPSEAPGAPPTFAIPSTGAMKSIELATTRLTPGRWHVTPVNEAATPATFSMTATTTAAPTRVEPIPGHYYNPQRSGHGVFLDYARNDWVLIWYTYREDKSSTWYMTDVSPRSATSWTSALYEYGWHEGRRVSTRVGWVSVNAIGESAFAFTYNVHGRSGHERFDRLGGPGCLSVAQGAPPLDVSGLWFAPELPGYGWSVQIDAATRQTIVASYLYDHLGRPAWLWSQTSIGSPGSRINLQTLRLDGSCPSCPYAPTVARADRGTVSLELSATSIQRMQLEHFGLVVGSPNIIEWQWVDRTMRPVVQLTAPSGCR